MSSNINKGLKAQFFDFKFYFNKIFSPYNSEKKEIYKGIDVKIRYLHFFSFLLSRPVVI